MKASFKKILSVFMAAVITASAFFAFSVSSFAEYKGKVPIIFIHGQGAPLGIPNEDGSFTEITYKIDKNKLVEAALENKNVFFKAFFTQDWTDFCDLIVDTMTDAFSEFALDKNGEPYDNSTVAWRPTEASIRNNWLKKNLGLDTFRFDYDWRLDPLENMDELENYIDMVLKVTGSEKYAICGRCEGACMILQYLEYYKETHGGEYDNRITDIVMYSSAALGASPIGEAFAGKLYVNSDAVERYIYDNDFGINKPIVGSFAITDEALRKIVTVISDTYGLDLACWAVNNVYAQIYVNIVPETLRNSYATFPGYWTMVADEYYDEAKKTVFGGKEDEYSVMIEKLDRYHYDIMNKSEQIIKEAQSHGIEVSNIVKYGFAIHPVIENCDVQSDKICSVKNAGWGVNSVDLGKTFDKSYTDKAKSKGTDKYISPDLCIDASTTWLKDTTWFVKNLAHKSFPESANDIIFEIVNTDGMDINTNPGYPQYMFYDEEADGLVPFNPEVHKTRLDNYYSGAGSSFFKKIKPGFRFLFTALTFIINFLMPPVKS